MKHLILMAAVLTLAGCGGGGGGSDGATTATAATTFASELEGVWIASTDNNPTGTSCGLTSSGAYGERFTVNFNENRFTQKSEKCLIVSGNKGSYLLDANSSGTFAIGEISLQSSNPNMQMRSLDIISMSTFYTSYNLVGKNLHIASPFQSYDGTSRDKRAFQIATTFDPATRRLVSNPTYVKQ